MIRRLHEAFLPAKLTANLTRDIIRVSRSIHRKFPDHGRPGGHGWRICRLRRRRRGRGQLLPGGLEGGVGHAGAARAELDQGGDLLGENVLYSTPSVHGHGRENQG